ncbi:MAG TPA: DUF1080 domain-containing protein [Polyangia bacterium]
MRPPLVAFLALLLSAPLTGGAAPDPNAVSADERAAGFVSLFDGRTGRGWRGYRRAGFPSAGWTIQAGVLEHGGGSGKATGNDLISEAQYDDFELRLEFRLAPGANSGIKYLVVERPGEKAAIALEYQLLDDERHPDAKNGRPGTRTLAGLYDLIAPPADKIVHPPGEWNEARIVVRGNQIEHWLNGARTVAFERGSPAFLALVANSKYRSEPGFAAARRGHILLQDHGDQVGFRKIRIRRLAK